jgi:hypothetical protein
MAEIVADHGPVLFHQSDGCCDGASPMCYPKGEFLIGDYDVKMGEIGGAPFYISGFSIRGLEAHRHRDRRRAGPRRHVLARQRPREALSRPLGDVRDSLARQALSDRSSMPWESDQAAHRDA